MKRSKSIFLCVLLVFFCLCGCSSESAIPTQHSVVLIAKSTRTEFWLSVFAGAEAAATEYNVKLTIIGPETEEDYEAQNAMVERAVQQKAEAIVFSAIDFENNAGAIDAAAQAGVQVVAIDSSVDSAAVKTYIGTDNYAAGRMAAQAALGRVEGTLCVGIVNYDVSSANGQERERGAKEAFEESGRTESVAVINTLAEAETAQADTAALLAEHPEINVLLAFNEPRAWARRRRCGISAFRSRCFSSASIPMSLPWIAFRRDPSMRWWCRTPTRWAIWGWKAPTGF